MTINNIQGFKAALGYAESGGNNYKAIYPKGASAATGKAFGKYQFIPARIKDVADYLSEPVPTITTFLNDPGMQERFFAAHVQMIVDYIIRHNLTRFIGQTVTGANKYKRTTVIRPWGLVAGAHLAGKGGLYAFLVNKQDRRDALGTFTSDYVARFSDEEVKKK